MRSEQSRRKPEKSESWWTVIGLYLVGGAPGEKEEDSRFAHWVLAKTAEEAIEKVRDEYESADPAIAGVVNGKVKVS